MVCYYPIIQSHFVHNTVAAKSEWVYKVIPPVICNFKKITHATLFELTLPQLI